MPAEVAETQDDQARLGLAEAGAATCRQVEIPEEIRLVLLVSDGSSGQVDQETPEQLWLTHQDDPQTLADALVAAVDDDADGYRDDATVLALLRRTS
ncbi:hypothetical protein [Streptomyces noursei]|uniref:hypothetical protein n=1 Tax=Streptomyces noursei TaxID=1971 RepID=UPI0035DE96E6